MKAAERPYKRLPGSGTRHSGWLSVARVRNTLWLGDDHLLSVDSNGYVEEYRRFYFQDIQALFMQRTDRREKQMLALGVAAALLAAPTLLFNQPWSGISGAMAVGLLLFFVATWSLGPTCACFLKTAVHTEHLAALGRVRRAEKFLERVRPVIASAQGSLDREQLAAKSQEWKQAGEGEAAPRTKAWKPPLAQKMTRAYSGRFHWWLFGSLVAAGLLVLLEIWVSSWWLMLLVVTLFSVLSVLSMAALLAQHRTNLPGRIKILTGVVLGFVGIILLIGQGLYIALGAAQDPTTAHWSFLQGVTDLSPWESNWALALFLYLICGSVLLGMLGLGWMSRRAPVLAAVPPPLRSETKRASQEST